MGIEHRKDVFECRRVHGILFRAGKGTTSAGAMETSLGNSSVERAILIPRPKPLSNVWYRLYGNLRFVVPAIAIACMLVMIDVFVRRPRDGSVSEICSHKRR